MFRQTKSAVGDPGSAAFLFLTRTKTMLDLPALFDENRRLPLGYFAVYNGDNPLILGPAGTMHMSVLDFAKWVAWHAGEGKRPPALVSTEIVKKLHTPVIGTGVREDAPPGTPQTGKYALGWGEVTVDWAPEPVITHTGSNTMNLALAMFWPENDFGFVIMTNIAGTAADEALRKLAAELYKAFSN